MTPHNLDDGIGTIADHLVHPLGVQPPTHAELRVENERLRRRLLDILDAVAELPGNQHAAVLVGMQRRQRARAACEAELARTLGRSL